MWGIMISLALHPSQDPARAAEKKNKKKYAPPAFPPPWDYALSTGLKITSEMISSLYPFKITSAPTPNCSTFVPQPTTSSTSAFSNLLVLTLITLTPLLSLTSSCAPTQHFAISFFAISAPPGTPAEILPPNHHGFWTRSNE